MNGNGKVELAGYTANDLAASAKGTLHFEWQHGTFAAASGAAPVSPALSRFDNWTADAEIANGALKLKASQVQHGSRSETVQAAIPLAIPPRIVFQAAKPAQEKR